MLVDKKGGCDTLCSGRFGGPEMPCFSWPSNPKIFSNVLKNKKKQQNAATAEKWDF
jgi:hypothetical protein